MNNTTWRGLLVFNRCVVHSSPSESQKVLYQPGKNYYKLNVFTGCKTQSTDFTVETFIKSVVGISSYKQFYDTIVEFNVDSKAEYAA